MSDGVIFNSADPLQVVRRLYRNGTIFTVAGTGSSGFSGDGGPATRAAMNTPEKCSVEASGAVLVPEVRLKWRMSGAAAHFALMAPAGGQPRRS